MHQAWGGGELVINTEGQDLRIQVRRDDSDVQYAIAKPSSDTEPKPTDAEKLFLGVR